MNLLIVLLCMLPCIACIVISAVLAIKETNGWGWFLFVGILLSLNSESIRNLIEINL